MWPSCTAFWASASQVPLRSLGIQVTSTLQSPSMSSVIDVALYSQTSVGKISLRSSLHTTALSPSNQTSHLPRRLISREANAGPNASQRVASPVCTGTDASNMSPPERCSTVIPKPAPSVPYDPSQRTMISFRCCGVGIGECGYWCEVASVGGEEEGRARAAKVSSARR